MIMPILLNKNEALIKLILAFFVRYLIHNTVISIKQFIFAVHYV